MGKIIEQMAELHHKLSSFRRGIELYTPNRSYPQTIRLYLISTPYTAALYKSIRVKHFIMCEEKKAQGILKL